ncbi:hypothetical protein EV356DRAFT_535020 [Viridothelium virens]|uniref:Rhodopsin domain-containing protein n=1 Tax=Viridothelium virens TaxID=1048519 RepID=A0A6A6H2C5_VIRVR|nr:hypothetical protein EV356DRAFT_535020 [Viridothelium virens]
MIVRRDGIDDGIPNPHGRVLSVVSITFGVISSVMVLMRLATVRKRPYGFDDISILIAGILAVALTVLYNEDVKYGWGLHQSDVSKAHLETALKIFYVNQILYKISTSLTKLSILALYLRIFPNPSFAKATWVTIFIVGGYGIATTLVSILSCTPIRKAWDKSVSGSCVNSGDVWYATAALVISTDLLLIILPVREVWKLHLPRAQKIVLMLLFGLGFFVMITTIVRIIYLNPATSSTDTTYYQATSNTWTSIEVNTGIICACIPTLKRPVAALFPQLFSRPNNDRSEQYHRQPGSRSNYASRRSSNHAAKVLSDQPSVGRVWTYESDEEIMLDTVKRPGEIMRTMDIEVAHEDASSRSSH